MEWQVKCLDRSIVSTPMLLLRPATDPRFAVWCPAVSRSTAAAVTNKIGKEKKSTEWGRAAQRVPHSTAVGVMRCRSRKLNGL